MDLYAIQPIPRQCPIPRHLPAHIGGIVQENPLYVLRKGNKEIVIQAHSSTNAHPNVDPENPTSMLNSISALKRTYDEILGVIKAILPNNDYIFEGTSNWGYLRKERKSGQFWIYSRPKRLRKIECPIWGSHIREEEIEFRVWGLCADRRGFWKGLPVDITYAWNDKEMEALDRAMHGWKAIEGLDLTFEVYGHLIRANGEIIGLVSESATPGRMITKEDKVLVWDAISRVEKAGCLYQSCLENRFMILGNKVRLMELGGIKKYEDQATLKRDAEIWHWEYLRRLFEEFDKFGPYGNRRLPLPRFTATADSITILFTLPGRPDLPSARIRLFPLRVGSIPRQSPQVSEMLDEDQPWRQGALVRRRPCLTSPLIFNDRDDNGAGTGSVLAAAESRHVPARAHIRVTLAHHPYRHHRTLIASERLSAFSTTEDTNSTTFSHLHN